MCVCERSRGEESLMKSHHQLGERERERERETISVITALAVLRMQVVVSGEMREV